MKILLITDGIMPYVLGGMQKHSGYLAKYLTMSGSRITLVHCVDNPDDLPTDEEVNMGLFQGKHRLEKIITLVFPKSARFPGHYIYRSYKYSELVFDQVRDELSRFDFVYAKGFSGWKLLREKRNGLKCPPIGIKFHGMNMFIPVSGLREKLEQYILRPPALYNLRSSDYVFSYGGKVTGTIEVAGIERNKIIEIATGIENSWIRNSKNVVAHDPRKFLFVGRYDKVKGIEELNEAISGLSGEKFEFHFVGPFPQEMRLANRQVTYHGYVKEMNRIKKLMDQMDVVVLPSFSEGMPNVVLEGISRGLAVIATDVGAVSQMVNGDNGILLQQTRADKIKEAMLAFIRMDNDQLCERKQNSISKARMFSWESIAERHTRLIAELIKK